MSIKGQKYKMLVTDMDYTLLNKDKKVSGRNRAAILKAAEKGVYVVVATGRIYTSARVYAKLLGLSTPIISSNGAIIRESAFNNGKYIDKTIYKDLLDIKIVDEMIRLSHQYGIYCHFFTDDTIYAEKLIHMSLRYKEWNKYLPEEDQVKVKIVDDFFKEFNNKDTGILKASVIENDMEKLQHLRNEIIATGIVSVSSSMKDNIEVMNKNVSKGNAVKRLAQIYGIDREEIIAVGDNENDMSMIEYAGIGVAMGNAEQILKDVADYVTADYQEDGVADVIEKFIL